MAMPPERKMTFNSPSLQLFWEKLHQKSVIFSVQKQILETVKQISGSYDIVLKGRVAVILQYAQTPVWILTRKALCHWGRSVREMSVHRVHFPAHNVAPGSKTPWNSSWASDHKFQQAFSAVAHFPWVCHPSTTIANSDQINTSRLGPLWLKTGRLELN